MVDRPNKQYVSGFWLQFPSRPRLATTTPFFRAALRSIAHLAHLETRDKVRNIMSELAAELHRVLLGTQALSRTAHCQASGHMMLWGPALGNDLA